MTDLLEKAKKEEREASEANKAREKKEAIAAVPATPKPAAVDKPSSIPLAPRRYYPESESRPTTATLKAVAVQSTGTTVRREDARTTTATLEGPRDPAPDRETTPTKP
jgi:hypothetical protein